MPIFPPATHDRRPAAARARARQWVRALGLAIAHLLLGTGTAWSDVPLVYHSPADDGVPLAAPIDVLPGASLTLYLYVDGGSDPSTEIRCATGSGDEVCFWNVVLQGAGTVTITSFTPNAGIVHHQAGATIGINGGDPWRGDLGPQRIGEMVIDGGALGGALELVSGEAVDASLGIASLVPTQIVPEPAIGMTLWVGALLTGCLTRRRAARRGAAGPGDRPPLASIGRGGFACRRLPTVALGLALALGFAPPAEAQTSIDCGDVVPNGVIDAADLGALRGFLAGDPAAPDLQGDPAALLRCDVTGDGLCNVGDYARIRRYMIDLTGGLNETCPLAGTTYPAVVLAAPVVDQASTLSTDRSSILLSGTAEPGELIRVEGVPSLPSAAADVDGTWEVDVPLVLDAVNTLDIRRDFGGGYLSETVSISVTQTNASGTGRLEGFVYDATTEDPIQDATVSVHGVSTMTDAFGRFQLGGLAEGGAILRVASPGYVPSAISTSTNTAVLTGDAAVLETALEVSLVPLAATQTVGAAGGTLSTPSGFELIIPAGSLATDTAIALTDLVGTGAPAMGGLPMVDIGPASIVFDPPAVLRMPISGFAAGQPADFLQVDQATGVVTPAIGLTNGSGVLELEIHSSSGDQIESFGAYKYEADFPRDGVGVPVDKLVAVDNCDSPLAAPTTAKGERLPELFTGDPAGGASPLLRAQLEANPGSLIQLKGLLKPAASTARSVVTPPSSKTFLQVIGVEIIIEQPIYAFRHPEGGGDALKNQVGTLRYQVLIPETVVIDRVEECPRPEGSAYGDPHLIRFDHVGQALPLSSGNGRFDFQASGEFVLFESTDDDMVVQARFEPANNSTTVTTAIAADVDGDRVTVYSTPTLDIRIEGVPTPLTIGVPFPLPGGGELERVTTGSGNWDGVWIRWSDGSEVLAYGWANFLTPNGMSVFPDLGPARFARVQGLLGNANGVIGDDLNLRDGTPSTLPELYTTFADSWRISQAESLFDYEPGEDTSTYNGVPVDPDYTVADLDPVAAAAAEADCIAAGITEDPSLSECIIDVVVFGDPSAAGPAADALIRVPDRGINVSVAATSNIWGAGLSSVPDFGDAGTGNGTLPPLVTLPPGTGRTIRFLDAAGGIRFFPAENPTCPPDGKPIAETTWGTWGGLTGPVTERRCALAAVFLSDDTRPSEAPEAYECGNLTDRFVAPEVGQIFCPGDGLTPALEVQEIFVPDDATRLYLGELARFTAGRPPGWYGDNSGTHEVILEIVVPE